MRAERLVRHKLVPQATLQLAQRRPGLRSCAVVALLTAWIGASVVLTGCAAGAQAQSGAQVLAPSPAPAAAAPRDQSIYVDAKALDLSRLLPAAPANDSAETRAELDLMLTIQRTRTDAQSARAKADAQVSIYRFADALGNPAGFEASNLPLTQALFAKLLRTEGAMIGPGKDYFARPRPFVLEPRLTPLIAKPDSFAYPSGHTTWSITTGLVLADMVPERRAEILARAAEYGHNRVVVGVHYPSDVEGGKLAGTALAALLFASPEFLRDYAIAKKELRQVLHLPTQ